MATGSRLDSPQAEIITGAVVLGFFAFVQAAALYEFSIGVTSSPTSGLMIFFIIVGAALLLHGRSRSRRGAAHATVSQQPPLPPPRR